MIYVSESQLTAVEYLINQSKQGNHVLFDNETLRRVFWSHPFEDVTEEKAYEVEPIIERLILEPSLEKKRAFLENLDSDLLEKVVRTYFNIVENNIYETLEVHH